MCPPRAHSGRRGRVPRERRRRVPAHDPRRARAHLDRVRARVATAQARGRGGSLPLEPHDARDVPSPRPHARLGVRGRVPPRNERVLRRLHGGERDQDRYGFQGERERARARRAAGRRDLVDARVLWACRRTFGATTRPRMPTTRSRARAGACSTSGASACARRPATISTATGPTGPAGPAATSPALAGGGGGTSSSSRRGSKWRRARARTAITRTGACSRGTRSRTS